MEIMFSCFKRLKKQNEGKQINHYRKHLMVSILFHFCICLNVLQSQLCFV